MSFYNNSQNGYTTTWTNTGSGFTNNWGGMMDYGANPTNFGSIFTGGMSGGGEVYINIPGVTINGQGNKNTWNRMANYEANMNSLYNALSGVSSSVFHSFNPFFGQNGPEPGGGGLIMMDSVFDIFGILLAEAKPQNRYLAYAIGAAAIVASKGRATDDVLRGELAAERGGMTTLYRSVSPAELADIAENGLRVGKTGYATEKLFATTAKDAAYFSKAFYPWDKTTNTIIKVGVPNNVMKQAGIFEMDRIKSVAIPANQLQNINSIIPLNYSPIP